MTELTRRQREIRDWIAAYWAREGISPSIREIGVGCGIASTNGVECHLAPLEERGSITRKRDEHGQCFPRSIRVAQTCDTCAHWDQDPIVETVVGDTCQDPESPDYMRPNVTDVEASCRACENPQLVNIDRADEGYLALGEGGAGLDYPVCDLVTGPKFGCAHWAPQPEGSR
jgi:repressor LexA